MSVTRTLGLRAHPAAPVPRTAMVLAAGLGKRMRPLTATRPKPLVEVAGKALLDHALDQLEAVGVERAVVNVHYLADALEAHLKRRARAMELLVSDERAALLDTGGALVEVRDRLGADPFFVLSSDVLWVDGPASALRLLAAHWDDARMDVLMLLVPLARAHGHRGQGDFHLDARGRITSRRQRGRVAPFVYTSVQIVSPRVFVDLPDGAFSQGLFWDRAIAAGRIFGVVHQGLWFEIGVPAAIGEAEAVLAHG